MHKPTLTFETILAAVVVVGATGCSRGERAAPESLPPVTPAATATASPVRAVEAVDAGIAPAPQKSGVQHACGANSCSGKKGGK